MAQTNPPPLRPLILRGLVALRPVAGGAALSVLGWTSAGCDLPTDPPIFETQWAVAGPQAELPVERVLPPSVTVPSDRSGLEVSIPTQAAVHPLADLCEACAGLNGQTVLKPAFSGEAPLPIPLPVGLAGGDLTSGSVTYELENRLGFDPLQPGLANRGLIVVSVLADGVTVGADSIDGVVTAFPSGRALSGTIELTSEGVAADSLVLRVAMTSPLGQPTRVNTAGTLRVRAMPSVIALSSAWVEVGEDPLVLEPRSLPLESLDDRFRARLEGGTLTVSATNPFPRGLDLTVEVAPDATSAPFQATTSVAAGATGAASISLTREEILTLAGATGRLTGAVVLLGSGAILVGPLPILTLTTEWRFNLVSDP